jgi:hypothetical protein
MTFKEECPTLSRVVFAFLIFALQPFLGVPQQPKEPATARPAQWEYIFVECVWQKGVFRVMGPKGELMTASAPGKSPIIMATELGASGWELAGVLPGGNDPEESSDPKIPRRKNMYTLIFKRIGKTQ